MPQIELKESFLKEQSVYVNQSKQPINTMYSPYLAQYKAYFKLEDDLSQFHNKQVFIKKYQNQLSKNGFFFNFQQVQNFKIVKKKVSLNQVSFQIQIFLSIFRTSITILVRNQHSEIHNQTCSASKGSFGQVYFALFNNRQYAIKCQNISTQDKLAFLKQQNINFENCPTIYSVIRQYFFYKLFSALRIGPCVYNISGFQIVLYKKCAQFSMQICSFQATNSLQNDLKNSLLLLHKLKIIHKDIKAENIMYSLTFEKNVLIDFGSSILIKQNLGRQSLSLFVGTIGYCSQQMTHLIKSSNQRYVDLYYNDLYGLSKSIKNYQNILLNEMIFEGDYDHTRCSKIQFLDNNQIYQNTIFYLLFSEKYSEAIQFMKALNPLTIIQIEVSLITYFYDLIPNKYLKQIYDQFLSDFVKQENQFCHISQVYSKQLYCSCQHQLLLKKITKKDEALQKENCLLLNQIYLKNVKMQIYFILISEYISFTQNNHQTSIQQKKIVCDYFLNKFPQAKSQQIITQQKQLINILYTKFYILTNINQIKNCQRRYVVFRSLITSLFLMNFKIQSQKFWEKLFDKFCQSEDSPNSQIYCILLNFYFNFQNILNQSILSQNTFKRVILKSENCLQVNFKGQSFISTSNQLFNLIKSIFQQHLSILSQKSFQNYLHLINQVYQNSEVFYKACKKIDFIESCLCILINYGFQNKSLPINQLISSLKEWDNLISRKIINLFKIKSYTNLFIKIYSYLKQYRKIKFWLRYFDLIVNCEEVSFKYCINQRFSIAFYFQDNSLLEKILKITADINIKHYQNLKVLLKLSESLDQILVTNQSYLKKLNSFKIKQKILSPLIKKTKQVSNKFLFQLTNQQKLNFSFQQFKLYSHMTMNLYKFDTFLKQNETNIQLYNSIHFQSGQKNFSQVTQIFKAILTKFVNQYWQIFGPFWKKYFQLTNLILIHQIKESYQKQVQSAEQIIIFIISTQKISIEATNMINYTIQAQRLKLFSQPSKNKDLQKLNCAFQFYKYLLYLQNTGQFHYLFQRAFLLKHIWDSFFILKIQNQKILDFCLKCTQFLQKFCSPSYFQCFHVSFNDCFLQEQNKINKITDKKRAFSEVCYQCIKSKVCPINFCYIVFQLLKVQEIDENKFKHAIKWISLSLQKANYKLKQIILSEFFLLILRRFLIKEEISNQLLVPEFQVKFKSKYSKNILILKFKNKFNEFKYLIRKHFKHMFASQSFHSILNKLMPFYINFPHKLKKKMHKKIRKYHSNLQNCFF